MELVKFVKSCCVRADEVGLWKARILVGGEGGFVRLHRVVPDSNRGPFVAVFKGKSTSSKGEKHWA
jgi:hypothetical protein